MTKEFSVTLYNKAMHDHSPLAYPIGYKDSGTFRYRTSILHILKLNRSISIGISGKVSNVEISYDFQDEFYLKMAVSFL